MTEEQDKKIRQQLLAQRSEALRESQEHSASDLTGSRGADQDAGDRAERESERALDHQFRLDDQNLIHKIDHALRRLDEGTYENCEKCGAPIPIERLLAKPAASLCLSCQNLKEQEES